MSGNTTNFTTPARRTLAAIVFTDVADFSALMGHNEERTLALVHRDLDFITKQCQAFDGRVLKGTGDGLLMYFDSAVQAVACALQVQQDIVNSAKALPEDQVLKHRIGIHLGDVFLSEKDVMGDGVNVAARLQAEAEPNGICISQTVYDVVKNRLAVQATYLGPRDLKNIKDAVPVYQILLEAATGVQRRGSDKKPAPRKAEGKPRSIATFIAVASTLMLLAVTGAVVYWALFVRGTGRRSTSGDPPAVATSNANPTSLPAVTAVPPTAGSEPVIFAGIVNPNAPILGIVPMPLPQPSVVPTATSAVVPTNTAPAVTPTATSAVTPTATNSAVVATTTQPTPTVTATGPLVTPTGTAAVTPTGTVTFGPVATVTGTTITGTTVTGTTALTATAAKISLEEKLAKEIDAARKTYLTRYNFNGMMKWLEKNNLKDSAVYERYRKMSRLKAWTDLQLQQTSEKSPLVVTAKGPEGDGDYKFYQTSEGSLSVQGPKTKKTMELDELDPQLFLDLTRTVLRKYVGTGKAAEDLTVGQQSLGEELKAAGLVK